MDNTITSACLTIPHNNLIPLNKTMGDEMRRLDTFKHWPKPHIVKPHALAQAGFYYLNRDDYVQCAYCLGTIYNWIDGDNAMEEHRRLNPTCSFIKRVAPRYKCVKCCVADVEVVNIPCLHINCCQKCTEKLTNCLVCKQGIKSSLKVRFSHENETFTSRVDQCD